MTQKYPILLAVFAFALLLIALPLPFWTVIMDAPTYPEKNLSMRVYTYMYEGDIQEWNVVGNLVGVKVPPPIPEVVFTIVPLALIVVMLISLAAAFIPKLLKIAAIAPWVLIAGMTAFTQYSLYLFGHDLDPNAPLRYVKPFTPPVIGVVKVGSLTTYHLPHIGSFLLVFAALSLFWAFRLNKSKENIVVEPSETT